MSLLFHVVRPTVVDHVSVWGVDFRGLSLLFHIIGPTMVDHGVDHADHVVVLGIVVVSSHNRADSGRPRG